MLMPFGKYKGHDLTALPDAYLIWLTANIPLRAFTQCDHGRDHCQRIGTATAGSPAVVFSIC